MDATKENKSYLSYGFHLLLSIVTLGVWNYIWFYKTTNLLNEATGDENGSAVKELLLCMFVPFYTIFWYYKHAGKVFMLLKKHDPSLATLLLAIFLPGIVPMAYLQAQIDKCIIPTKYFYKEYNNFLIRIKFDRWKGWVYLAPCIVLLLIFTGWPILNTLRMAFLEGYDTMEELGGEPFKFGIGNFTKVLEYRGFKDCLKNTMLLCVITVPVSTFLALLISVCLNSIKAFSRALQTIYFLPYVTNSIAIGMVFAAMFNMVGTAFGGENELIVTAGIINNVIEFFGGDKINWINEGSSYWANMFVMVVYIVWNALPFKILILLGGLQSVNKQYYDAAKIDATPKWRVFTKITVPLLSPMIAYVVITGFIGGFKEYSSIVGIFGDDMGPTGAPRKLNTMVGFIYRFIAEEQGRASAAALILFAIIFAVTMINLYVSKKKTHY